MRERAFSPVFAQFAIPIYSQVCNIKGQISARPNFITIIIFYSRRGAAVVAKDIGTIVLIVQY